MKKVICLAIVMMFVICGVYRMDAKACNDPVRCGGNNTAYGGAGGQGGAGGAGGNGYGYGYGGQGGNGYGGAATATGGNVSINSRYEDLREMAIVMSGAVTSALRFKEGTHSDITDSRVMKVDDILDYLSTLEYEECKRGRGDVKIIDGLVRSQFEKTTTITFHKTKSEIDPSKFRFMGFLTGIAAVNDATMENVVYGVGEKAMDHGATDIVKVKESATEWGDTTGYSFNLGGFVTSIIGGAGSRAIGPGGSAGVGYNGMQGGSADRSDVKFAIFVSNDRLKEVSKKYDPAEIERKAKEEVERKAKIDELQRQIDELKK